MQHLSTNTLLQNGKYKIEKVLGQGGFGITYLATQVMLDRKVCIKEFFFKEYCDRTPTGSVISTTSSNKEIVMKFLNKFIKEARTISQLNHPNIIRILDIFEENGTAYYVMEYIDGCSLANMVERLGVLGETDAVGYIKQVGNALDYIHKQRINHLDVKPANIMIRKEDDRAILIDFGVSKQYDMQGDQTSTTPVGVSYGYAPMEQYVPGGVSVFSPQTDIYALGATLYYLLTAKIPPAPHRILTNGFIISSRISASLAEAIRRAMEQNKSKRPANILNFISLLNIDNSANEDTKKQKETTKSLSSQGINRQKTKEELRREEALRIWDESSKGRRYHVYEMFQDSTLQKILLVVDLLLAVFFSVAGFLYDNYEIFGVSLLMFVVITGILLFIEFRVEKLREERANSVIVKPIKKENNKNMSFVDRLGLIGLIGLISTPLTIGVIMLLIDDDGSIPADDPRSVFMLYLMGFFGLLIVVWFIWKFIQNKIMK